MNPFDWRGPQFLLFFVVLAIVVAVVARIMRNRRELEMQGYRGTPIHDPYAIAFLRGGTNELVRVAVVSLVDRGLLWVRDEQVVTTDVGRSALVRRRIEKDVLDLCKTPCEAKELFAFGFQIAAAEIELELKQMGLLPDDAIKAARRKLFWSASAVLLFFSVVKIAVALSRGRTNVGLLMFLTPFALLLVHHVVVQGRTARGQAFLAELRNLFQSLKLRAGQLAPGGATSEVAMLVGVFGLGALPPQQFGWSEKLFKKATSDSSGGSCGSSCGSGCGGGCGGGGCGGCGG